MRAGLTRVVRAGARGRGVVTARREGARAAGLGWWITHLAVVCSGVAATVGMGKERKRRHTPPDFAVTSLCQLPPGCNCVVYRRSWGTYTFELTSFVDNFNIRGAFAPNWAGSLVRPMPDGYALEIDWTVDAHRLERYWTAVLGDEYEWLPETRYWLMLYKE